MPHVTPPRAPSHAAASPTFHSTAFTAHNTVCPPSHHRVHRVSLAGHGSLSLVTWPRSAVTRLGHADSST
eukprot:1719985-Rhodomonas_salina.3